MTLHLLSFIMDFAAWVAFGLIYSTYIFRLSGFDKKSSNIASVKIILVAVMGGLIATADRALPEYGFSLYHFLVAMIFAFMYSLGYLRLFRKYVIKRRKYVFKKYITNNVSYILKSSSLYLGKNLLQEK